MAPLIENHAEYDPVLDQSPVNHTHDQKRPDETTYAAAGDEEAPATWGIGWRCPTLMAGFVICGAMLSIGHHFYYRSLDNTLVKSVDQQTWALRIGTGFAFLIKTLLVSAVGIAAAQETWATLRRKSVKLRGIDGMFAVLTSPIAFLIPDIWIYAKTLTLLAIISWLIPLTAVFTPATLSVRLLTTTNITQLRVPTVNFTDSFWRPWVTFVGMGMIGEPASDINRLFTATSSSAEVLPASAPFPDSSYTLEFWGPSYKCQSLSEALGEMQGMTFTDSLGHRYSSLQNLWDHEIGNATNLTNVIYSGTAPSALNNTLFVYAAGSNPLGSDNATQPAELVCQLWNTSYVVDQRFTNGARALTPISTELVAPANWSSRAGSYALIERLDPAVNGGYYVMHMLFSGLIQRTLTISASGGLGSFRPSGLSSTSMSIMQTGLFACPELWNSTNYQLLGIAGGQSTVHCRNKTLARAIEDLSHNFTYSLLSLNAANTSVPITVSSPQNFYNYNSRNLLAAYMTALGVAVACVVVGFTALRENGVSQSTSFSSVLMTTRNPELDHLLVGHCLGSDQLDKTVGKVRLQFGEIQGAQQYRHAAFGTKDSVTPLSKGVNYY
ncbi:uncharacterized protein ACLA_077880 [Aspergillus clavatus NRRL 1]|uniref:Formylmethionine deformylase-like protein n=1 Tax=Aspergillus clavatus (strain ATCC 1007 / CBS 513.65 / DSM 816 / NCTC 3887 / NRRL 1 / QM 1276 / 107) TaxID=344612 RepID=A1CLR2_ASPCL|nr:uncharacterized protein ACLA_077880 [Aspergillus clavatus NRRL 1]EAW09041.1 conserved hypothetical protein [Aspergillus clavatus NRRL 1]